MRLRITISVIAAVALLSSTMILAQDYGEPASTKVQTIAPKGSILSVVQQDSTMAMFVKHANKSGLSKTLEGKGPFTVFAPTNDAFNARTKEDLDAEHKDLSVLQSTMQYHVISGKQLTTTDLMNMNGQTLAMDNGQTVPVVVQNGQIMVGSARVTGNDILATNGIIHVVDHVLIPGKEAPMSTPVPMGK
jgi:uncharacterized surface protein with fasciclin (FAS1) repeats